MMMDSMERVLEDQDNIEDAREMIQMRTMELLIEIVESGMSGDPCQVQHNCENISLEVSEDGELCSIEDDEDLGVCDDQDLDDGNNDHGLSGVTTGQSNIDEHPEMKSRPMKDENTSSLMTEVRESPKTINASGVCQSMPEYARVCQSMQEYARVCQ